MATPNRSCPFCGATVTAEATACGTCGRPVPQAAAPAPSGPAKTMFGYAAPNLPPAPKPGQQGQNPGPGAPAAAAQPPPQPWQQPGAPAPQPPAPQPPPAQHHQAPPQPMQPPAAAPGQPQQSWQGHAQAGAPQPGQPQPGQPPQPWQQPGAPQQQAQPYPQPGQQQAQPYPQPGQPQQQWQQPGQPQQAWQQPGQPQQQWQQPGQPQQGWPQQAAQPGHGGDPLAQWAGKLPQSQPGTVFGIPLSTLRDPRVERTALIIAGAALLISIILPLRTSPTVFVFSKGVPKFDMLIWPLIVAAGYLFVAFSPPNLKQSIPPVVLRWLPFGLAFASIVIAGLLGPFGGGGAARAMEIGFPLLVFGLVARLSDPQDVYARVLIGIAVILILPYFIDYLGVAFKFSGTPALMIITQLLMFLVLLIAVASIAFAIPPAKVPALQSVDAFAPLVTAILLAWWPVFTVLWMLALMVHADGGLSAILMGLHSLIYILAYFGILMFTAPEAWDEAKKLFSGTGAGQQFQQWQQQPGWQQNQQWQQGQGQQQQWQQGQGQQQQWQQPGQQQQWQQQGQPQQPAQPPQPGQPPGGYPPGGQGGQGGQGGGWPQQ